MLTNVIILGDYKQIKSIFMPTVNDISSFHKRNMQFILHLPSEGKAFTLHKQMKGIPMRAPLTKTTIWKGISFIRHRWGSF